MRRIFMSGFFIVSIAAHAQISTAPVGLNLDRINELIDGGLKTVIRLQKTEDNIPVYWKGEWGSTKQNIRSIPYLGPRGKSATDSNCFTTGHIFNELSIFVLRNPEKAQELAPSLEMAFNNILTFKTEKNEFSFWHKLKFNDDMKTYVDLKYHDLEVYRPNQYSLTNNFTAKRANVPADSDDTSLGYSAIHFRKQLSAQYPSLFPAKDVPMNLTVFDEYRDKNRNRVHPVNKFVGNFKNTEAFLTWFSHEEGGFVNGLSVDWREEPRIPFSVNDVDCVVNANVLQSLARHGNADGESSQSACRYIEKAIDKGLSKRCGFYYPSPYYLHYSVAKAFEAGASCLEGSARKLKAEIKKEQNQSGYWGWEKEPKSDRKKYIEEPVSTTVYAFNALLIFSQKLNTLNEDQDSLDLAALFIANSAQVEDDKSVKWHEGVFFSGGGFVRRVLVWSSEAYTTTLALTGLDNYKHTFYINKKKD
jgi:hypothetical protein